MCVHSPSIDVVTLESYLEVEKTIFCAERCILMEELVRRVNGCEVFVTQV